jgi:hypothetical protein
MTRAKVIASFLALGLLTACDGLLGLQGGVPGEGVRMVVTPKVIDGGYRAQQTVSNYTKTDIDMLVLELYKLPDEVKPLSTQTVSKADLTANKAAVFSKLQANTSYRVLAKAFKGEGDAATPISDDANSKADIVVENDDEIAMMLSVQLIDMPFGATSSGSIDVKPGGYAPKGTESISVSAN